MDNEKITGPDRFLLSVDYNYPAFRTIPFVKYESVDISETEIFIRITGGETYGLCI